MELDTARNSSNSNSNCDYMDVDSPEDLQGYHVAGLIDELKHDDVQYRLNSVNKLLTIAEALGQERTRDELIPFLQNDLIGDEDEVLLALAEQLPKLTAAVGGPVYATYLLPPLESLVSVEEAVVRDKAVWALCELAQSLSPEQLTEYFIPMLKRLSTGEWFTSRASAAGLYAAIYKKCGSMQIELQNSFAQLIQDASPMVRRASSKALADFTEQMTPDEVINVSLPLFYKVAGDEQDSVRLLAVDDMIAIAKMITARQRYEHLVPTFDSLTVDCSWRVKYMLATKFVEVAEAFGNPIVRREFTTPYLILTKDPEAEVRTAVAGQISGLAQYLDKEEVLERLLPCVQELTMDTNEYTRAALAKEVSGLAPIFGKEAAPKNILPVFLQLLRDDSSVVRLSVISKLDELNDVVGMESLSQYLLRTIMELSEEKEWRIRLQIVECMPVIARQLGESIFDAKLTALCMSWLQDKVYAIRKAATTNLKNLAESFGVAWTKKTAIPQILNMAHAENYLHRMTTLFALTQIAKVLPADDIKEAIIPTVVSLSNDSIPNIRFNVAKSLEELTPLLQRQEKQASEEILKNTVVPVLNKLARDTDGDVRYFAQKALENDKAVKSNTGAIAENGSSPEAKL
ncbi:putative ser/thr protein phosphatase 2A regulatory subunit A [Zychaea mexicana]|uniref:putative ser/thr protein phosphatase 2A regulatory subunit A n=1 Tax=Zychaea mexicana TaxID=64656 RepID=UPI0022FE15AE|nr:putative ser/thr protein phosphatase 2A regulatory subunit A [Zychaea mexicana]KAI9490442.1 putative ser/thr protein phosphatase 2A regulatory subunit A [Zychaea mexicana]